MSLDNTTMMEIYPYGGFMAYLKYHYLDGVMKQTVMLIDKTRVDYDKDDSKKSIPVMTEPESDKDISEILNNFGIGQQKETK